MMFVGADTCDQAVSLEVIGSKVKELSRLLAFDCDIMQRIIGESRGIYGEQG